MSKTVYKISNSFYATDKVKSDMSNRKVTKLFVEGDTIVGGNYDRDHVIVDNRYILPKSYLEETKEITYLKKDSRFDENLEHIKQQAVQMSEKEKERLDKSGQTIKDTIEGKTKTKLSAETKSYRNGALLGLGCGIITALYFRKNIFGLALIGTAIGGYVSHEIYKSRKGNNVVTLQTS